jgi:hypothetical protein
MDRLNIHRIEEAAWLSAPDARVKLPVMGWHGLVLVEMPFAVNDKLITGFNNPRDVDGHAIMATAATDAGRWIANA